MFITHTLQKCFNSELTQLVDTKIQVEIQSSGEKGSPKYKLKLSKQRYTKKDVDVDTILSEGEKTCVALAAFLTELATATHSSTSVFDDPVSSLGHRWREKVAERLVKESEVRQIIVFTHDFVFANKFSDAVAKKKINLSAVTVSREAGGTGIVSPNLSWRDQKVKERIKELKEDAKKADGLYKTHAEEAYRKADESIYSRMRACWERVVEEVVLNNTIQRYDPYIKIFNLQTVLLLTMEKYNELKENHKKCSGITNSHDSSSVENRELPPPHELEEDIEKLDKWVESFRQKKQDAKS